MVPTSSLLSKNVFYECRGPLNKYFGAEVHGIDLKNFDWSDESHNENFFAQLKDDLEKHRLLLFKKQDLSGNVQVDISRGLGRVHSTFYKHPKSPHPDIFRVSNDDTEGCTNVGRSGWHIDGTFLLSPFAYQTMYFPSVVDGGDTDFVPLKELYECQDSVTRDRWDRLWMVTRDQIMHPLVYKHPNRDDTTLCFHCGGPFVYNWIEDDGHDDGFSSLHSRQSLSARTIQREIEQAIHDTYDDLVFKMQWEQGDFAINDNVALAHYACDGTQQSRREVGLRVLHRTTILDQEMTLPCKEDGRTSRRLPNIAHDSYFG